MNPSSDSTSRGPPTTERLLSLDRTSAATSSERERSDVSTISSRLRLLAHVDEHAHGGDQQRHRQRKGDRHPDPDREPAQSYDPPSLRSR